MRVYKKLTSITALIAIATFVTAVLLHYLIPCKETEFWVNVCLSVFGSAILTVMTSIIFYHHEKRNTLEGFVYHTRQILSYLNKYQESMSLEQKLLFFLDYNDLDKSAWDSDYGNVDFFFNKSRGDKKYIYECIYKPIAKFNNAVANHAWHFRWHLDGSGKNEVVMQKFLSELQEYLLEKTGHDVPTEYDENGNATAFCHVSSVEPKLVLNIQKEFSGRYFEIMYGKKMAREQAILEEGVDNE